MKRLLVLLAAAGLVSAAAPKHDWKTGMLMESAETREVAGASGMNSAGVYGPAMSSTAVTYATMLGYVIKGDDMGWMVEMRIRPASLLYHPKRPNVTVHGPIKYCFEKGKFYLLDEDGVEFEMTVIKKEALPPPDPPKQ